MTTAKSCIESLKAIGFRNSDIAFGLGVTPNTVSNWVKEKREPRTRDLDMLKIGKEAADLFKANSPNETISGTGLIRPFFKLHPMTLIETRVFGFLWNAKEAS